MNQVPGSERAPAPRTSLLGEARRRGVVRVATSYAVIAWLLIQIAATTFPPLGVPDWALTALIVAGVVGFPIALALAWFLEITPEGIERDASAGTAERPHAQGIRRYADAIVIAVLVAVVAVLLVRQRELERAVAPPGQALAVLPFRNLSGDPEQEYFSDGLSEELIGRLGTVPGLRVAARASSFALKGKDLDAAAIAERLNVDAFLEGSVRRTASELQVNAALVNGRTGFQLWTSSFRRTPGEIFAIQEEIVRAVAEQVLAPEDRRAAPQVRDPTTDISAHDLYLLAIANRSKRSPQALERYVGFLEKAIAKDPNYAQAHAALARAVFLRDNYAQRFGPETIARAEKAAYRALSLDPGLADSHAALGLVLRLQERPGAKEAYERALAINPNDTVIMHDYAVSLGGNDPEATKRLNARILELDPLAVINRVNYIGSLQREGKLGEARQEILRGAELHAGDADAIETLMMAARGNGMPSLHYRIARMALGPEPRFRNEEMIAWTTVDGTRTLQLLDASKSESPIPHAPGTIRLIAYVFLGRWADAEGWARQRVATLGTSGPESFHRKYAAETLSFSLAMQGRFEEALAAIPGELTGDELANLGSPPTFWLQVRLLVYAETGRMKERATALELYRRELLPRAKKETVNSDLIATLAAVESLQGRDAAAIEHIRAALRVAELPRLFRPEHPWFKRLEGKPGYDELAREYAKRLEKIKDDFRRIDEEAAAKGAPLTASAN